MVAHHEGREEAQTEAREWADKQKEAKDREENYRVLEAIRRERAELDRQAAQGEPLARQPQEQPPAQQRHFPVQPNE